MLIAFFLVLLAVTIALVAVLYRLLWLPLTGSEKRFDYRTLGRIEKGLPDLQRVIVIADHIEDPQDELRAAVKHNLKERGVRYLFLVSTSRSQQELNGYYKIFSTLAEILRPGGEKLVDIQELPYDWPTFPVVVYETRSKAATGSTFVAYRGSQRNEGIADYYSPLAAPEAQSLALAVLAGAPRPIEAHGEFKDGGSVVPIASARQARAKQAQQQEEELDSVAN